MSDVSPRLPDIAEFSFREGLIVVVSVCGLLSLLVFLRLICNVSLDICILCDVEQARRSFSAWNDFWCPCFRRQRMVNPQPEEGQVQQQAQSQVGAIPPPDLNSLLSGLSKEERVQILGSLLPFKTVSNETIKQWEDRQLEITSLESGNDDVITSVTTYAITCSICLHDMNVGDEVVIPKRCEHLFHRECILEWVNCNHTECPYCRAEIITRTDVENVRIEQQPFILSQVQ